MIVTFISQCQKKALNRTRKVLDAFADRIGDTTWQTVITEEGLIAVKKLLKRSASKNTAVACHWIRSRRKSELVWIVGNRSRFSADGCVPVNITQKNLLNCKWENDWLYLPAIKAISALASLLHDLGKANVFFQEKLTANKKIADPMRHEWISCLLISAIVEQSKAPEKDSVNDEDWLKILSEPEKLEIDKLLTITKDFKDLPWESGTLPPFAQAICWIILSHHRLPYITDSNKLNIFSEEHASTPEDLMRNIKSEMGYSHKDEPENFIKCLQFKTDPFNLSEEWKRQLRKWSLRLKEISLTYNRDDKDVMRLIMNYSRLCVMLADHYVSSQKGEDAYKKTNFLLANTDGNGKCNQTLDEHLLKVSTQSLKIAHLLSSFESEMEVLHDIKRLRTKSPAPFTWQDNCVRKISDFKKTHLSVFERKCGCFAVNMASTGTGKTIANAKIMRVLSEDEDSLRYILALGLRTLTLQTGDEYREKIGLQKDELSVVIGSSAIQNLHKMTQQEKEEEENNFNTGESAEHLFDDEVEFENLPELEFLNVCFSENKTLADKYKSMLYKPLLVCTIDHIIRATETIRGGKYILPYLRLCSSDLVIDEVDDFSGSDLIAIARLIHLAGMLGRKVMISSATIPPALAEGFFYAYKKGWDIYAAFKEVPENVFCLWCDEYNTKNEFIGHTSEEYSYYNHHHKEFVSERVKLLRKQNAKRKAYITDCSDVFQLSDIEERKQEYFKKIQAEAILLHEKNHTTDPVTGKKVSFGVIRIANVQPCIQLASFFIDNKLHDNFKVMIMPYHSRQVLLMRHVQEKHLDEVLKRKEKQGESAQAFKNEIIRKHLDELQEDNVLFILVATPVEEVGRDHDFDWAIIEPSSFRSIIQMAGRILRHRSNDALEHNIAIMQYNLKALVSKDPAQCVFCRPGFESGTLSLESHNLSELLDEAELKKSVNAIPRIEEPEEPDYKKNFAHLEHEAVSRLLRNYSKRGPKFLQGWLNEYWWMTALPQQFNMFRDSSAGTNLYLCCNVDGELHFYEKNDNGDFILREELYGIKIKKHEVYNNLWLERNYIKELEQMCLSENKYGDLLKKHRQKLSEMYGEVNILKCDNKKYEYSDQFGMREIDN